MEEEENNPMKALENRTSDSKREMEILDALQDLRQRNARHERVAADGLAGVFEKTIEVVDPEEEKRRAEEEEDEALVRAAFGNQPAWPAGATSVAIPTTSKADSDDDDDTGPTTPATSVTSSVKRKAPSTSEPATLPKAMEILKSAQPPPKKRKADMANALGIKIVKSKGKAKA
ncbi:hypothetical protein FRC03_008561 [Tulasnella sp. 419]|nr:hypothetical protein FRC03_008561 [Tulasnella sp. 419]